MAFNIVGAVAIKVRPDSTGFKEEARAQLEKAANGLEVEVDLEPGDLDVGEIRREAKRAEAKARATGAKVKIPVKVESDKVGINRSLNETIREWERLTKGGHARVPTVKIDLDLDRAAAMTKFVSIQQDIEAAAKAREINIKAIADFDVTDFMRQIERLERSVDIDLTPDIDKSFKELRGLDYKLDVDIDFKKARIQKNLDELNSLRPLMMSVDPEVNTTEVRTRWEELRAEIEADRVDVKFDLDRKAKIAPLIAPVDVDEHRLNREIDSLFARMHTTLHPDVELDRDRLRNLDLNLEADVDLRSEQIQQKLDEMQRLHPRILSMDPEINTADVRARWEELKVELERDHAQLKVDIDRRQAIAPILAPVEVDSDSISRSMRQAMSSVRSIIHPDVELDRRQLKDLHVELEAGIEFKKAEIQAKLAELSRLEQMVLSVDPEINTKEVREQWDRLKKDLSGDTVELKADLDRKGRVEAELAAVTRNRHADIIVRINQRSLATAKATLEALAGVNVLRRAGNFVERIATNIDNYALKLGKIGLIVGNLSNVLGSATATLVTFGSQLGQLGGFALGIPAALGALVAIGAAGKAAFQGFGDAVGGSFEAMQQLPKEAQAAARSLQGVWTSIQQPAQRAFWAGMGDSMQRFVQTSLPQIRAGMTRVSGALGEMLSDGLQGLTEFARRGQFSDLLGNLAQGLKNATPAAFSLSDAFVTIGDVGASYFPRIGTYIANIVDNFDRWVRKSEASGKLTQWMDNAVKSGGKLWDGLKDLTGIFGGVADAARRAGAGGIDAFASQMSRIRGIIEGPVWQGTMTTLFEGARQGAKALYQALGPIGDTLVTLAPTLKSVFLAVGETVGNLLSSIANAMQSPIFQGGLLDLFTGIQVGMEGLSKHIPGVVDGLGSIGSILGSVFRQVLPAVGRGFEIISGAVTDMAPTLKQVGVSLGGVVNDGLSALAGVLPAITGPLQLALDLFNALPQGVQTTLVAFLLFKPVAAGLVGVVGNLATRMAGAGSAFASFTRGLTGGLATAGITLALVAVANVFQAVGERAEYAKESARAAAESVKAIATEQLSHPFDPTGGPQAQQRALDGYLAFIDKMQAAGISGLDNQPGIIDALLGQDSEAASRTLKDLEATSKALEGTHLNGFAGTIADIFGDDSNSKFRNAKEDVDNLIAQTPNLEKMKKVLLESESGRRTFITSGAADTIEMFGRITSKNAPLIERSLNGTRKSLTGFKSEAEIMALALGGTADNVEMNSVKIAHGLEMVGESPRSVAKFMTDLGFTGPQIQKALTSIGVSAEDAGEAAKFGFGSVAEATRLASSELAKNTPLLYKGSDGITELSRALSETTGINADFLASTLRSTGVNAEAMASGLAAAGVPASTIKDVLSDLGVPAQTAAEAMGKVAGAAQSTSGAWSSFQAQEFTAALDAIGEAAGTAADKANALWQAIDKLRGGVLSTEEMTSNFEASLDGVAELLGKSADELSSNGDAFSSWSDIIDDSTGAINLGSQAGRDLAASMRDLGQNGLTVAQDAFTRTYQATGNVTQAMDAAKASVQGQVDAFRANAAAIGLNGDEVNALLSRYNLLPEQIATEVAVDAVDADSKLKGIVGLMSQMAPGVTANIGIIDDGAKGKLEDLGVQLHQLDDGTWEATLSADPTEARAQVDGFIAYASSQTTSVKIGATQAAAIDAVNSFLSFANTSEASVGVKANKTPAETAVQETIQWIDSLIGIITTGNNTDPAAKSASSLGAWVSSIWATITTGNNTAPAQAEASNLIYWINGLLGAVTATALTGQGRSAVSALLSWISGQSASVTVYTNVVNTVTNIVRSVIPGFSADGNIYDSVDRLGRWKIHKFAKGGFFGKSDFGKERHVAHITKRIRVFGEPETGGEAYIPLAASKRARSLSILEEVADRFNRQVVQKDQNHVRAFADGGVIKRSETTSTAPSAGSGSGVTIVQNYPQVEKDSTALLRASQELSARGLI